MNLRAPSVRSSSIALATGLLISPLLLAQANQSTSAVLALLR